jgi:hypothetical protein
MLHAATFLILLLLLLIIGGPTLVWKFLRGYFRGVDLYVIVTVDGQTLTYKNPHELLGHPDEPLDMIPNEILMSDRFETYYNICWFECGTLFRCGHSFHKTEENVRYCDKNLGDGMLIGRVLEEN